MRRICDGVYQTAGDGQTGGADALCYAVEAEGLVLIDSGASSECGERIADGILAAGRAESDATDLVLTHGHVDHIGGSSSLRARTGCRIACHEGDEEAIRTGDPVRTAANWYGVRLPRLDVDTILTGDGGKICGLDWMHAPGHSPGSIVLTYKSRDGLVLFGQDIHGPFFAEFGSDVAQWAASMRRVMDLNADILCEGHYGIFRGREKIRRFIEEQLRAHEREIK